MSRRYAILDVFTRQPLAGNPLENIDAVTQARLIVKDGVRQDTLDA